MRIFEISQLPPKIPPYLHLQKQASQIIIQICKVLEISVSAMHASLWIFHCNSIVMGYHHFDRYVYACGALLVGTKLMESIRYPTHILAACRKLLRGRKNLGEDEDSEEYLKKEVKNIFEAEVNIMINIGFDFDICLALQQADKRGLFQISPFEQFSTKLKQTLTSIHMSEVVTMFNPETILFLGLRLLIKKENRSIDAIQLQESIKEKIISDEVKHAQRQFVQRSVF